MMEVLFLAEFIVFTFIFILIFKNGFRKHLALLFVATTMFLFMFISPFYGFKIEFKSLFNNYLWDYYPNIMLNYLTAVISFLLGYLLLKKNRIIQMETNNTKSNYIPIKLIRIGLFIGIGSFILWGLLSGKSLSNIFLLGFFGLSDNNIYPEGVKGNNYLLLMIETLIPLLVLSIYSNMKKPEIVFWIAIVSIIFLSQGFRYRFILLLSSFLLVYLLKNKLSMKKVLITSLTLFIFMYSIIGISDYRHSIRDSVRGVYIDQDGKFGGRDISHIIFASTRNYLAFGSLLKYMDSNNISYGYGETMFGHIFIRMIPSTFFENNAKPRPPAIEVSAKSWGSREALYAGEAYGGVGGVYYEFGTIGVAIFFMLIGMITKWLDQKIFQSTNKIRIAFYIVITISLFKIITRGYLPEFFFSFGFMMLPFIYIKIFLPKLWRESYV